MNMVDIIFQSLVLDNFRCHQHMEFNFIPNRFVIITGKNGSGKTSIFDAICWCLYDITTKGRKGDTVVRKRSGKDTAVILKFMIGNNQYEIQNYRNHSKHGNNKILMKNNIDISGVTVSETNKLIKQIVMPSEIFLNCLLFSQYIGKAFTELTHSGQKDILDGMLGLGRYEEYYHKIVDQLKLVQADIDTINNSFPVLQANLLTNEKFLEKERKLKEEIEEEHERYLLDIGGRIKELNDLLEKTTFDENLLLTREQDHQTHSSALIIAKQKLENIEEEFKNRMETLKTQYRQIFETESEKIKAQFQKFLGDVGFKIQNAEEDISGIDKQLDMDFENLKSWEINQRNTISNKYDQNIQNLEFDSQKMETERMNDKSLIQQLDQDRNILNQDIEKMSYHLNAESPRCFTCGQEIPDQQRDELLEELQGKKTQLKGVIDNIYTRTMNVSNLEGKISNVVSQLERLHLQKNEEIQNLNRDLTTKNSQLRKDAEAKKSQYIKEVATLKKEEENINQKVSEALDQKKDELRMAGQKEAISIKKEIDEKKDSLKQEAETLEKVVEVEIKEIGEIRGKKTEYDTNAAILSTKLEDRDRMEKQFNSLIEDSGNKIQTAESIIMDATKDIHIENQKLQSLQRKFDILSFWKKAFSDIGIKAVLLDEAIPIMNEKARELSEMTEGIRVRFDSQSVLKSGEYRNKFAVNVIQTANLTDDRLDFSGGEGRVVDIITLMSLRYLLERMVGAKFNIYLFDEILDALDLDNITMVINMIRKLAENHCAVLISHTLRDYVEGDEHLTM